MEKNNIDIGGGSRERLEGFLACEEDSFVILQLDDSVAKVYEHFTSLARLRRMGNEPDPGHYRAVYTGRLDPFEDLAGMLERLFFVFNEARPDDYFCPSMSVSDIVGVRHGGKVTYHYVDSVGFAELPGFKMAA